MFACISIVTESKVFCPLIYANLREFEFRLAWIGENSRKIFFDAIQTYGAHVIYMAMRLCDYQTN